MRKFLFVTFLSIFFPLSASANSIFSCEAKRVQGDRQTLRTKEYSIIYPIIIVDNKNDTLLYVYSEHGDKWEDSYKIIASDVNNIVGKSKLQADWIKLIHFELDKKEFSVLYAGDIGNTLTFGKCYGD